MQVVEHARVTCALCTCTLYVGDPSSILGRAHALAGVFFFYLEKNDGEPGEPQSGRAIVVLNERSEFQVECRVIRGCSMKNANRGRLNSVQTTGEKEKRERDSNATVGCLDE